MRENYETYTEILKYCLGSNWAKYTPAESFEIINSKIGSDIKSHDSIKQGVDKAISRWKKFKEIYKIGGGESIEYPSTVTIQLSKSRNKTFNKKLLLVA